GRVEVQRVARQHEPAAQPAAAEEERGEWRAIVVNHRERGRAIERQRREPVLDPTPRQEERRLSLGLEQAPGLLDAWGARIHELETAGHRGHILLLLACRAARRSDGRYRRLHRRLVDWLLT